MPIYEYECVACHNVVEVVQRISEEPLAACPACAGSMKKLVSRSAFHLKGSGWYADGYSSTTGCNGKPSCSPAAGAGPKDAPTACPAAGSGSGCCAGAAASCSTTS